MIGYKKGMRPGPREAAEVREALRGFVGADPLSHPEPHAIKIVFIIADW